MRTQITFKDWLRIVVIVFFIGVGFLLLEQIPFINSFFDKLGDYIQIQNGHIY